jgi:hypothetical protein
MNDLRHCLQFRRCHKSHVLLAPRAVITEKSILSATNSRKCQVGRDAKSKSIESTRPNYLIQRNFRFHGLCEPTLASAGKSDSHARTRSRIRIRIRARRRRPTPLLRPPRSCQSPKPQRPCRSLRCAWAVAQDWPVGRSRCRNRRLTASRPARSSPSRRRPMSHDASRRFR